MATAKDCIEFTGFNDFVAGEEYPHTYGTSTVDDGELRDYSHTLGTGDSQDNSIVMEINFDGPEVAYYVPSLPHAIPSCNAIATALSGQGGNDTLVTYTMEDWLVGGAGNDLLKGMGERDILHGVEGRDTLYGGDDDGWV